jgi:hypothetical protein
MAALPPLPPVPGSVPSDKTLKEQWLAVFEWYAEQGFVPVLTKWGPQGKKKSGKWGKSQQGWARELKDAEGNITRKKANLTTHEDWRDMFEKSWPDVKDKNPGVGLLAGVQNNLVVIDVDCHGDDPTGAETWARFCAKVDPEGVLIQTLRASSSSPGGFHLYFRPTPYLNAMIGKSSKKNFEDPDDGNKREIDLLYNNKPGGGPGQLVHVWPTHKPGKDRYEFTNLVAPAPIPDEFVHPFLRYKVDGKKSKDIEKARKAERKRQHRAAVEEANGKRAYRREDAGAEAWSYLIKEAAEMMSWNLGDIEVVKHQKASDYGPESVWLGNINGVGWLTDPTEEDGDHPHGNSSACCLVVRRLAPSSYYRAASIECLGHHAEAAHAFKLGLPFDGWENPLTIENCTLLAQAAWGFLAQDRKMLLWPRVAGQGLPLFKYDEDRDETDAFTEDPLALSHALYKDHDDVYELMKDLQRACAIVGDKMHYWEHSLIDGGNLVLKTKKYVRGSSKTGRILDHVTAPLDQNGKPLVQHRSLADSIDTFLEVLRRSGLVYIPYVPWGDRPALGSGINLYHAIPYMPDGSDEARAYASAYWKITAELMGAPFAVEWRRYLAWIVRNPGKAPRVAVIFYGQKGAGKGRLVDVALSLFGDSGKKIEGVGAITGEFNSVVAGARFLMIDEIQRRKRDGGSEFLSDKLKALITNDTVLVNKKGIDHYKIPNEVAIVATTNDDNPVYLSPDERRIRAHTVRDIYRVMGAPDENEKRRREKFWKDFSENFFHEKAYCGILYDLAIADVFRDEYGEAFEGADVLPADWSPEQMAGGDMLSEMRTASMPNITKWVFEGCPYRETDGPSGGYDLKCMFPMHAEAQAYGITSTELFLRYLRWMDETNHKGKPSTNTFNKKIRDLGWPSRKSNSKVVFDVNQEVEEAVVSKLREATGNPEWTWSA